MADREPFTGAVLTGGASTRMGRDKALVEVDGVPLALVAAWALTAAGAVRVVAVGGDATALRHLGLEVVADRHPGEGPLGGVLSAFGEATTDVVVVLACDLPGADGNAVSRTVDALLAGTHPAGHAALTGAAPDAGRPVDVAWPVSDGRSHVLHAAWRRSTAGPALEAAFASGQRSVRRAALGLRWAAVDGIPAAALRNANRPGDLLPPDDGASVGGAPPRDDAGTGAGGRAPGTP